MGKKKIVKKTKELLVAIAESSSMSTGEPQQQQQTPRKRGRPRKIVPKAEELEEVKEHQTADEETVDVAEGEIKKLKTSFHGGGEDDDEEEETENKEEIGEGDFAGSSSSPKKEDDASMTIELSQKQQILPRSRARRKSKPRKSS